MQCDCIGGGLHPEEARCRHRRWLPVREGSPTESSSESPGESSSEWNRTSGLARVEWRIADAMRLRMKRRGWFLSALLPEHEAVPSSRYRFTADCEEPI